MDEQGKMNRQKWLSDEACEKRLRRVFARYGLKLHKSRKRNGGYTVFAEGDNCADTDGTEQWFSSLYKLQDLAERLEERYG